MGISRAVKAVTKSRVGRRPVQIPAGAQVSIENRVVNVKGQKGSLTYTLHPLAGCEINDQNQLIFFNADAEAENSESSSLYVSNVDKKTYRSIVGTTRVTIANMLKGVTEGFSKTLTLIGVGYRAQLKGSNVVIFNLGYSQPREYILPEGITVEIPTPTEVIIKGINKFLVGSVADKMRALRPPECYKGKGVRHQAENVIIKEVKKK